MKTRTTEEQYARQPWMPEGAGISELKARKAEWPEPIPGIMDTMRAIRDANSLKRANMTHEESIKSINEGAAQYWAMMGMEPLTPVNRK